MPNQNQTPSATIPDWSRETCRYFQWAPERKLVATIRAYQSERKCIIFKFKPIYKIYVAIILIRHRFWSVVSGADIPLNYQLGGGFLLKHGQGVVIHPGSKIGVNCLVMSQVVIGADSRDGLPIIGGHVDLGTGAKILGPVSLGDNVKIGANAVVVCSVPSSSTAVGIPARIIPHD